MNIDFWKELLPFIAVITLIWGVIQFYQKRKFVKKDRIFNRRLEAYLSLQTVIDDAMGDFLKIFLTDSVVDRTALRVDELSRNMNQVIQEQDRLEKFIDDQRNRIESVEKSHREDVEMVEQVINSTKNNLDEVGTRLDLLSEKIIENRNNRTEIEEVIFQEMLNKHCEMADRLEIHLNSLNAIRDISVLSSEAVLQQIKKQKLEMARLISRIRYKVQDIRSQEITIPMMRELDHMYDSFSENNRAILNLLRKEIRP
jgi:hypothetical protein